MAMKIPTKELWEQRDSYTRIEMSTDNWMVQNYERDRPPVPRIYFIGDGNAMASDHDAIHLCPIPKVAQWFDENGISYFIGFASVDGTTRHLRVVAPYVYECDVNEYESVHVVLFFEHAEDAILYKTVWG